MPRTSNRQSRSVGNLGDVLKHAALVELASVLLDAGEPVHFIDTHAFLLRSPLADSARWEREVEALGSKSPAPPRYVELERASLARTGDYRCSAGLVMDVLGARRRATDLGELDGLTRASLREQVKEEELEHVDVADDAKAALRSAGERLKAASACSLLVHVDPFSLSAAAWATLAPGLDTVCERAVHAVLVVYRYTRSAPTPWPAAPRGVVGPVAHVRGGSHEVAVYASSSVSHEARARCASLGWRTLDA